VNTQRSFGIVFALVTTGVVLAGCGVKAGDAGNIAPMSSPPTSAATDTPGADTGSPGSTGSAPKVDSPLNPAPLLSDSCAVLSSSQLSTLGLKTGKPRTNEIGETCTWQYSDGTSNTVNVVPMVPNKNGLSDLYDQKDQKAYFEPTQIAGYPALYADITDDRSRGQCSLYVGVTDQLAVYILTQLDDGADVTNPCPVADKVGAAMVQTLKKG
jgi:hypothetical protein